MRRALYKIYKMFYTDRMKPFVLNENYFNTKRKKRFGTMMSEQRDQIAGFSGTDLESFLQIYGEMKAHKK